MERSISVECRVKCVRGGDLPTGNRAADREGARGGVLAFAEDPNFRGYARGVNRLFLNAVILGPSAP